MIELPQNLERNAEFNAIIRSMHAGRNIFLTGKAGTGKTTLIHTFLKETKKKVVVAAPTGIAAQHIGGQTLHSLFLWPGDEHVLVSAYGQNWWMLDRDSGEKYRQFRAHRTELLNAMDVLIIDEISMVTNHCLREIDYTLRMQCGNMWEPFGGKQIILVGDPYQLQPVIKGNEYKAMIHRRMPSPWFFFSEVFTGRFDVFELSKIYRQVDPAFTELLNQIREGSISDEWLKRLNDEFVTGLNNWPDGSILLATTNKIVNEFNDEMMSRLTGKEMSYRGSVVAGEYDTSDSPVPYEIVAKVGAQVLFRKNDPLAAKRFVNGTMGRIVDLEPHAAYIDIGKEGRENVIKVERVEFESTVYEYDEAEGAMEARPGGVFEQMPFVIAFGMTINKSQGQTMEKSWIDFGERGAFAEGQAYVAFSRIKTLQGLKLRRPLRRTDIKTNSWVKEFMDYHREKQSELLRKVANG